MKNKTKTPKFFEKAKRQPATNLFRVFLKLKTEPSPREDKNQTFLCSLSLLSLRVLVLVSFLLLYSTGHCADTDDLSKLTNSTIDTIFSPWVRKVALAFGGGFGLFQSYMGGSVRPLLTWGGLGLVVNFIPKLVDMIAKVGT